MTVMELGVFDRATSSATLANIQFHTSFLFSYSNFLSSIVDKKVTLSKIILDKK